MIDTSALVAAVVADHEHHRLVRPLLPDVTKVPAIALAETYSQLRRTFRQPAALAVSAIAPWSGAGERVLPTTAEALVEVLGRAFELDLGGNVQDALVAATCRRHGVGLLTLDRRQHAVALAFGVESRFLLA